MALRATVMLLYLLLACRAAFCKADWTGWGGGDEYFDHEYNARASGDTLVNSTTIGSLVVDCKVDYPLGISSSPSVVEDIAYFPTWNGSFVALDTRTCSVVWSINVTHVIYTAAHDYDGIAAPSPDAAAFIPSISKTTPQVLDGETVFFGTMLGALVVGAVAATGQVFTVVQLDDHPFAVVTMSPSFYDGSGGREPDPNANAHLLVLVGTDSMEQAAADRVAGYRCCSFVGRMFALQFDGSTLKPLWNISMIPPSLVEQGWSGAPLYGSQPAVAITYGGPREDITSKDVFIATGSAYTKPRAVTSCYKRLWNSTTTWRDPCVPRSVLANSVLHLNVDTGAIVWLRQLTPLNARAAACGDPLNVTSRYPGYEPINQTICMKAPSLDADAGFGMAPSIVWATQDVTPGINELGDTNVIIIGQKNGNLYAFAYDTGVTLWATNVGIYGAAAKLDWGVAIDDKAVYYTQQWHTDDGNNAVHGSVYGAARITNGLPMWMVSAPHGAEAYNPPTVVGDVVLTGYFDKRGADSGAPHANGTGLGWNSTGVYPNGTGIHPNGTHTNGTAPGSGGGVGGVSGRGALLALNRATGKIMKQLQLDSVFSGGIAVDAGRVLFGTGDCWADAGGSFLVAHVT